MALTPEQRQRYTREARGAPRRWALWLNGALLRIQYEVGDEVERSKLIHKAACVQSALLNVGAITLPERERWAKRRAERKAEGHKV